MDIVRDAIMRLIMTSIPKPILHEAFVPKNTGIIVPNSVDYYIYQHVVIDRILPDLNLHAGKKINIALEAADLESTLPSSSPIADGSYNAGIYRVPAHKREHHNIAHVIELLHTHPQMSGYYNETVQGNSVCSLTRDLLTSNTGGEAFSLPRPVMLSQNLIKLDPILSMQTDFILVALLEYDKSFTNINRGSIRPLAKLALVGTQAYIYNELILKIDAAKITAGQEYGEFGRIVKEYEGKNEEYEERLLDLRGSSFLDVEVLTEFVKMIV